MNLSELDRSVTFLLPISGADMPKMRFTSLAVERLSPPENGQLDYFDLGMPAFGLRISPGGAKSFFVMTRVHGKLVRLTIGRTKPTRSKPGISLKEAKAKAVEWVELAEQGLDPRQQVKLIKAKNQARSLNTFSAVAERFYGQHVEPHLAETTKRFYRSVLFGPDTEGWKNYPVSEISRQEVERVLDDIIARGSPSAANNTLAYLRKFFNWCAEKDLIEYPPTDRIKQPAIKIVGERVLSADELAMIWKAASEVGDLIGDIVKLLMLTGQRRMEVGAMTWGEIRKQDDIEAVWELPSSRTKNKRPHLVPLIPTAVSIMKGRPILGEVGYLFTTTGQTPFSGYSKCKQRLDGIIQTYLTEAGLPAMAPWTLHDLRRTMVTVMNEHLGIAPHVVEACVNHVSGGAKAGVAGVYNKALYMEDRRKAFLKWEAYIKKCVSNYAC